MTVSCRLELWQLPSVGLTVPVDHKAGAAYPVLMGDKTTSSDNRALLGLVAFIVFIDMMGIGLIMPVMPTLIMGIAKVSVDRAAEIGGLLFFAYAFMQFLFAPVIGGLSDRFGRRPVLLLTLAALGIDYAFMTWAPTLIWLFVGRIIAGVMGATWGAANSCIADIVEPEKRGAVFGMMGGAGAAGFVFGPVIGGLAGTYSDRLPFLIACVLSLGGALVGWFILRETLPQDRRRPFRSGAGEPVWRAAANDEDAAGDGVSADCLFHAAFGAGQHFYLGLLWRAAIWLGSADDWFDRGVIRNDDRGHARRVCRQGHCPVWTSRDCTMEPVFRPAVLSDPRLCPNDVAHDCCYPDRYSDGVDLSSDAGINVKTDQRRCAG